MAEFTLDQVRELVTAEPRTVSEIYREFAGLDPRARLTLAQKNERRRLADELNTLAADGDVLRRVVEIHTSRGAPDHPAKRRVEFYR